MSTTWIPVNRNYEKEAEEVKIQLTEAETHPLLQNKPKPAPDKVVKTVVKGNVKVSVVDTSDPSADPLSGMMSAKTAVIDDPLSGGSSNAVMDDPLSMMFRSSQPETKAQVMNADRALAEELQAGDLQTPWQQKKQQIRKEYTISGNLMLSSTALNEFSGSGVEDGSSTKRVDKYDKRLASLEQKKASNSTSNASDKIEISQKDYESHVERLFRDLCGAWSREERVATLKTAIQLAKLLSDTLVPAFYPSMFVMVTDALDKFGDLVFNRLVAKAEEGLNQQQPQASNRRRIRLPTDFTSSDVPSVAKETCRNWFYKTACIRELLPRIYVEIALIRCYRFLTESDLLIIIQRIGSVIRGLGDPLIAAYARLYLSVAAGDLLPLQLPQSVFPLFQDTLFSLKDFATKDAVGKKSTLKQTLWIASPAIEWMLKTVGKGAAKEVFQSSLQSMRDHCNDTMILRHIISSFDGSHYAHAALGMVTLTKSADITCTSVVEVLTALGKSFLLYPPPEDQRLAVLNEVWKIASKATDLAKFVQCTAAWLEVTQRHYSEREVMVLLGSLTTRLTQFMSDPSNNNTLPDSVNVYLESLISSLISQASTFSGTTILTSEHLLRLLDVFKGAKKVQLCRDILETLHKQPASSASSQQGTSDPVLINILFDLARIVHDSVDGLSPYGDLQYNSGLIQSFVGKVDFGRDLEQQLNFYVECRAAFPGLDSVKDRLIVLTCGLALKAYRIVKGRHTKKTGVFVKACLAYCHITIPSLADGFRRLELLYLCATAALLNQCLPQTDTFLKAAISALPELQPAGGAGGVTEERLSELLVSLLAFLVLAPGHPEHGPFYILHGLLNALPRCPVWSAATAAAANVSGEANSKATYSVAQLRVVNAVLSTLAALGQKRLILHLPGVQSNDELYATTPSYMSALDEAVGLVIAELLKGLAFLGEKGDSLSKLGQAEIALDMANTLATHYELFKGGGSFEPLNLALKLVLDLAAKHRMILPRQDQRYLSNTAVYLEGLLKKAAEEVSLDPEMIAGGSKAAKDLKELVQVMIPRLAQLK